MAKVILRPKHLSKRPIGMKASVDSFLVPSEEEKNLEKLEETGFQTPRLLLERLTAEEEKENIDIANILQATISFFQNIQIELRSKYQSFEEAFAIPTAPTPMHHRNTVQRHIMPRASSVNFSNILPSQKIKTQKRNKKANALDPPSKPLTASTIWNLANRFFGTVPTVERFQKYLKPFQIDSDIVPLGQHYSIAYNQKLKQRFKNDNVLLRVPETIVSPANHVEQSASVIFRRLLSAMIPLVDVEIPVTHHDETEKPPLIHDGDIEYDEEVLFPTCSKGTSHYSGLSFEAKLLLEVKSAGLNPVSSDLAMVDNEVMNDIVSMQEKCAICVKETNKFRDYIRKELSTIEPLLIQRNEGMKQWPMLIEKCEKEAKMKNSRPKSRDKLN